MKTSLFLRLLFCLFLAKSVILSKKSLAIKMNKKIKSILNQFRERVFSEFSNQIISIVVFGSYARGEEIMWELNFSPLISIDALEEDYFNNLRKLGSSFYRKIQNESISL